jgi:hypothetical protein
LQYITGNTKYYGSIFERGDSLADGSKAIGRRATFGLFSNVSASAISEDFLKAFNYSVWYTARADRIDALKFDWTMTENKDHNVKISYQAVTARTVVCDVAHERAYHYSPYIIATLVFLNVADGD